MKRFPSRHKFTSGCKIRKEAPAHGHRFVAAQWKLDSGQYPPGIITLLRRRPWRHHEKIHSATDNTRLIWNEAEGVARWSAVAVAAFSPPAWLLLFVTGSWESRGVIYSKRLAPAPPKCLILSLSGNFSLYHLLLYRRSFVYSDSSPTVLYLLYSF